MISGVHAMRPLGVAAIGAVALSIACQTEASLRPADPEADPALHFSGPAFAEWSEPVHLDAPVNSPFRELNAVLSRDGLSLFFGSDRPGGLGAFDIWVSRRDCRDCPWQEPVNLGPNINSSGGDGGAILSPDEHRLYFSGSRAGGHGGEDIWVSYRRHRRDDLGWQPAVNLGPAVNSTGNENGPALDPSARGADLYFARANDIYRAHLNHRGSATGAAVLVAELSDPAATDLGPAIAPGGREILFWSNRAGGVGGTDLWVGTRPGREHPWSAPQNLGPVINTPSADLEPKLSRHGRTLIFSAAQAARPGLGLQDLWMSVRIRRDHRHDDEGH